MQAVRLVLFLALIHTLSAAPAITLILGQPTDRSVTVAARADTALEWYFEYGTRAGTYTAQTKPAAAPADPVFKGFYAAQTLIDGLQPNTRYYYRLQYRNAGTTGAYTPGAENTFHTQRAPGSTFVFGVQGDSHPEREKVMFHPALYTQTLKAMAAEQPDFYVTNGDDFSVDTLRTPYTQDAVAGRYTLQLPYLDLIGRSAAIFLGTGNHEETSLSNYNLPADKDNSNQVPIWAQNARNLYYPSPGPNDANSGTFYTGNATDMKGIGVLRDYYAWTWGDALFVVIDPYWTSPVQVDTGLGGQNNTTGPKTNNKWEITHGDAQYQWLKQTLEQSKAKWKFIFAHHVLGTGRGGVEIANQFEWGGLSANGANAFGANRPGWAMPIHQLMVANKVTIFFQAHDHLFARQQLDGVVYQSMPNPADNTYTAFNADAYTSGDVFANAGYVKVTVGPNAVKVDYIRQWLPTDEKPPTQVSGMTQFSYTIPAGGVPAPAISSVNVAGGGTTIAPNTWLEIKGSNLSNTASGRTWQSSDFVNNRMPQRIDNVGVNINGKAAYVYYVSPTQINVLTPPDALPAIAPVQITVGGLTSPDFSVPAAASTPSLFLFSGTRYAAAVHADGKLVGPETLYPGLSTPAKPGETILLYGNGFGPTTTPVVAGSTVQSGTLSPAPAVTIAGANAAVPFAGLVAPGQFQFNITVPADAASGDLPVVIRTAAGATTPSGAVIAVRN